MKKMKSLRTSTRRKIIILSVLFVAFVLLQAFYDKLPHQQQGWLVPICYNVILAVSLNITVGILGELSLGHAGFMCVGAFTGAFIVKLFSVVSPDAGMWWVYIIAFAAAGILAALFGILIGVPVLRLKGDYLAIVTLAFGEIIWNLLSVTRVSYDQGRLFFRLGGTEIEGLTPDAIKIIDGAQGITRGLRMDKSYSFIIAFFLMFFTVWLLLNFIHSRTGRMVKAIRDNRIAAESIGINIKRYKVIAIAVSAFFAGVAGVLYALNNGQAVATQANYGYIMSINILVFVVLGGMGSTIGSVVAALLLTIIPDWLRFLNDYRMLIYALVLIGMMLFNSNPTLRGFVDRIKTSVKTFFTSLFAGKKAEKKSEEA